MGGVGDNSILLAFKALYCKPRGYLYIIQGLTKVCVLVKSAR